MSAATHDRDAILALIPHQGTMCLWDAVLGHDASQVTLSTQSHLRADNPLRSDDQLRAMHLCEYGAQAMAVHGGLLAQGEGGSARPGLLVALRGVELHAARIDTLDGSLECTAQVLARSDASQQYAFRILHGSTLLAEGRAAVLLQDAQDIAPQHAPPGAQ